ncbi:MAG: ArnT family glycosyltransferase [Bryobacteraceae bacterium]
MPDLVNLSTESESYIRKPAPSVTRHPVADIVVFLSLWFVVTCLQFFSGAFSGAFGSQPDEPSHYVTGLMIRDYIAAGFPGSPTQFAESFYLHYPRVAFGLWPPLFHIASGVWMFLFGESRQSALALLATVTALWGYIFFRMLAPRFGFARSLVAALLLISLPSVQTSAAAVMLDMAVAPAILVAMIQFGRYLETESNRDALLFGIYAAVAALVKYNGLMLALLPPLCVLMTGRYFLLRRISFWIPAVVVLVVAGPWYVAMRDLVVYAAEPGVETDFWTTAAGNAFDLVQLGGPVLFVLAMIGAGLAVRSSRRQSTDSGHHARDWHANLHVSAVGVLFSSWLFHTVLYPIQGPRYLLPAAASLIMLALLALDTAVRALRFAPLKPRVTDIAAMTVLILPYAAFTFYTPKKDTADFMVVADKILATPLPANSVILVASDAVGEGAFVSEIAMRGPRSRYFVARSSKFLARQTLMGLEYKNLFETNAHLMEALDAVPVSIAVLDECGPQPCEEHRLLLARLARDMPGRWEAVDSVAKKSGGQIRIYQLKGNEGKPFNRLSIDMRYTLGGSIGTSAGEGGRSSPLREPSPNREMKKE